VRHSVASKDGRQRSKRDPGAANGASFGKGVLPIIAAIAIGALFGGNRVPRSATIIERNKTYALAFLRLGVTKH
jgi:ABC-type dipeptide/oligopeptide/nickel transport system permease subunit